MESFWPGVKLHIDAYVAVKSVGNYRIEIAQPDEVPVNQPSLYFVNLGGYLPPEFEEYHKKILIVADNMSSALKEAKTDEFYRLGQPLRAAARSHIDDKMEVDQILSVQELLDGHRIQILASTAILPPNGLVIGYIPFSKLN